MKVGNSMDDNSKEAKAHKQNLKDFFDPISNAEVPELSKTVLEQYEKIKQLEDTLQKHLTEIEKLKKTSEDQLKEISNLKNDLNNQVQEVQDIKKSMLQQIKEISTLKTQMFGVVGFLITIFTFVEGAVNFYTPILGLVKMFSLDMLAGHSFHLGKVALDVLFLTLPIIFIVVTFYCASKFFKSMVQ